MTGLMYDSVNPSAIPADATEVAGYVDGKFAWSAADWARFTKATVKWRITAIPTNYDADVCDCETWDYTPAEAAAWAKEKIARGQRPIIYCSQSVWNSVQWQLSLVGVSAAAVDWWIADYVGHPMLIPGSIATQYEDAGPYDLSETNIPAAQTAQTANSAPQSPPAPPIDLGDDEVQAVPFSCTTDANGWTALDVDVPNNATKDQVVNVVMDWASAYDPGLWHKAEASVDFEGSAPGRVRVVVSGDPNHFFTGRVVVA